MITFNHNWWLMPVLLVKHVFNCNSVYLILLVIKLEQRCFSKEFVLSPLVNQMWRIIWFVHWEVSKLWSCVDSRKWSWAFTKVTRLLIKQGSTDWKLHFVRVELRFLLIGICIWLILAFWIHKTYLRHCCIICSVSSMLDISDWSFI